MIIGSLGQVGNGATYMSKLLGVQKLTLWDINETKGKNGPFKEILDHDIFVNCINLQEKGLLFLTRDFLLKNPNRKLSMISDISCDVMNPANPIPIYSDGTSLKQPLIRIIEGNNPLDLIAIDYLPTLVPEESSREFGDLMLPHLLQFNNTKVWSRAEDLFHKKCKEVLK